jgi:hypothetical protein
MDGESIKNANSFEVDPPGSTGGGELGLQSGGLTLQTYGPLGTGDLRLKGDLNLSGNSLANIGGIDSCSPNEYLAGDGSCKSPKSDSIVVGDADGNGVINYQDTIRLVYGECPAGDRSKRCDVNGDGDVDTTDATLVERDRLKIDPSNLPRSSEPFIDNSWAEVTQISKGAKLKLGSGLQELDMNGKNLSNVGGFKQCGPDEALTGDGSCKKVSSGKKNVIDFKELGNQHIIYMSNGQTFTVEDDFGGASGGEEIYSLSTSGSNLKLEASGGTYTTNLPSSGGGGGGGGSADGYIGNSGSHSAGGNLDMGGNKITNVQGGINIGSDSSVTTAGGSPGISGIRGINFNGGSSGFDVYFNKGGGHFTVNAPLNVAGQMQAFSYTAPDGFGIEMDKRVDMNANDINNAGTINADTKNFVQSVNTTHEAVYTSQESPMPRAVLEGEMEVESGEARLETPRHFSQVVSDSEPEMNVQLTPEGEEAEPVAATDVTRNGFRVKQIAGQPSSFTVNYRMSGVREGHTDKQVVRLNE